MTKYIDAEKLKYEIERRKLSNYYTDTDDYEAELFEIIGSLQQEQPEESASDDLEEAAKEYIKGYGYANVSSIYYAFIAGAEWQAKQLLKGSPMPEDTVLFNKGVEEGKRLMMEEAVEGEIQMRYSGCLCAKTIRAINEDKFKFGDKVRIVIVKED